jgi:peptidoglycan hydrolase-like protein with peptidoglycan-binding domain
MSLPEIYSPDTCPTLKRGTLGLAVKHLQTLLVLQFDDLETSNYVDGDFGPGTEARLREFQRLEGLVDDGVAGEKTWTALMRDRQSVRSQSLEVDAALARRVIATLDAKRFDYLDDGRPYHLNIIGLRDASTTLDKFDDRLMVLFTDDAGVQQTLIFPITTDPGAYYTREKLLNEKGVAILVPGQYSDVYKIDKHQGKYDALCQRGGEVKVWRDGDRDTQLDRFGQQYSGYYGINIHRSRAEGRTPSVGKYSAGCQVFQSAADFAALMSVAGKSRSIRGNRFTYTLLEADKLEPDPTGDTRTPAEAD